jgi:NitT/TauT family transport system substrate-binding protein
VTEDNSEVEFVVYANADLPAALANGSVDAIAGGDPSISIAGDQYGFVTLLDTATDFQYGEEYCCLVFVSAELAEKNPELAEKVTRAFMKSSEWVADNIEEAAKIQVEKGYVAGDVNQNTGILKTYNYIPSVQGGYDALVNSVTALNDIELLRPETDADKLIENSFLFFEGFNEIENAPAANADIVNAADINMSYDCH